MTLSYLVPLRRDSAAAAAELFTYLRGLADVVQLIVVDGSPPDVFARHAPLLAGIATHVPPDPRHRCPNGKTWGVLTGLTLAGHDTVVIADDDVRWDSASLERAQTLIERCDLLVPANHFDPMVWHAAWDTGRILINRALAHDWPGTLVVRRSALTRTPPYDGTVLFENCEMVRTVAADGGRVHVAADLLVARRPPNLGHFVRQRPRQAYDDLAQPVRLVCLLAVLPLALAGRRRLLLPLMGACVALAEVGRRRHGGRAVYPWYTSLCAPLWLAERALLVWWTLWLRGSGRGAAYAGRRFLRAAHSTRALRAPTD